MGEALGINAPTTYVSTGCTTLRQQRRSYSQAPELFTRPSTRLLWSSTSFSTNIRLSLYMSHACHISPRDTTLPLQFGNTDIEIQVRVVSTRISMGGCASENRLVSSNYRINSSRRRGRRSSKLIAVGSLAVPLASNSTMMFLPSYSNFMS